MSKWECGVCGKKCVLDIVDEQEGFRPVCCPVDNTSGIKPDWHPVDEPATKCSQLPKLTEEVFERPDCPEWAKWAAVDEYGMVWLTAEKPNVIMVAGKANAWSTGGSSYTHLSPMMFDSSDWQNSLIKRPAKLPDWCKPGAWVWVKSAESYEQIEEIEGRNIICGTIFFEVGAIGKTAFEARLRPYNADEMKALVGQVIENKNFTHFINSFDKDLQEVVSGNDGYSAKALVEFGYTLDGSPCGVLEHFDPEWEEWVK